MGTERLAVAELLLDAAVAASVALRGLERARRGGTPHASAAEPAGRPRHVRSGAAGMNHIMQSCSPAGRPREPRRTSWARIRASAESRRHNVGVTHQRDVDRRARPRPGHRPSAGASAPGWPAARRARRRRPGCGARAGPSTRNRAPRRGLRLAATDAEWAAGAGREVRGSLGECGARPDRPGRRRVGGPRRRRRAGGRRRLPLARSPG